MTCFIIPDCPPKSDFGSCVFLRIWLEPDCRLYMVGLMVFSFPNPSASTHPALFWECVFCCSGLFAKELGYVWMCYLVRGRFLERYSPGPTHTGVDVVGSIGEYPFSFLLYPKVDLMSLTFPVLNPGL